MGKRILVSGASGAVGSVLVDRLLQEGEIVVPAGRDPGRLAQRWPGTAPVRLDVLDAASVGPALGGIDVAYYLVHSMEPGASDFEEQERRAATAFAEAATAGQVRRVVYLGGLGGDEDQLSPHLRSRHETGRTLAALGPPLVELRASIVLGARSASFRMMHDLVRRLPAMIVPRWVDTRTQPIAIADVVSYLAAARDIDLPEHHTVVEIGGPDVVTFRWMLLEIARIEGRRRLIVGVPFLSPRLSSYWCGLTTSVPSETAKPLVLSLRNETVVRDDRATRLFPGIRPLPLAEALRRALDGEG